MSHLVFLLMNILSSCQFDNSSSLLEIAKIALELHLLVRDSICFNSVLKRSLETFYTWTRLSRNVTNIWLNTPSVLKTPKLPNPVLTACAGTLPNVHSRSKWDQYLIANYIDKMYALYGSSISIHPSCF